MFAQEIRLVYRELRCLMLHSITKKIPLTPDEQTVLKSPNSGPAKFFDVWSAIVEANHLEMGDIFEVTLEDITEMIEYLQKLLKEMLHHPNDAIWQSLQEILENARYDSTYSIENLFSKMFKFATPNPRRHKLLRKLRSHIKDVQGLNNEHQMSMKLPPTGRPTIYDNSVTPFLDKVRRCSYKLYNTLSGLCNCHCHESLAAMLKLESREAIETTDIRFSLIFKFQRQEQWEYQESNVSIKQKFVPLLDY